MEIRHGAILVTDAHYNKPKGEDAFLAFVQKIQNKEIPASQLFLFGDIFDALFGGVPHTAVENQELIDAIDTLSKKIEVVYLEGNHDFRVKKFFSGNVEIFPISKQPLYAQAGSKTVCLAHGDFDAPFGYRLYTSLIRNPFVLFFLNIYDSLTAHSILRFVEKHMSVKEQCKKFTWFESFIQKRFEKLPECDIFIEGHFHQNVSFTLNGCKYINLGAFACNQRYFVVEFDKDEVSVVEKRLS